MTKTIRARFDVLAWDEAEPAADRTATPATVRKSYRDGLVGTSTVSMLMTRNETGAAYTAIERLEGTLGDRAGELCLVHGGIHGDEGDVPFGYVVPGSGTGGFAGVTGTLVFGHDEEGGFAEFDLVFPSSG